MTQLLFYRKDRGGAPLCCAEIYTMGKKIGVIRPFFGVVWFFQVGNSPSRGNKVREHGNPGGVISWAPWHSHEPQPREPSVRPPNHGILLVQGRGGSLNARSLHGIPQPPAASPQGRGRSDSSVRGVGKRPFSDQNREETSRIFIKS